MTLRPDVTYLLPLRSERLESSERSDELTAYLRWLAGLVEVVVVDGSPADVHAAHHARWAGFAVHVPPDETIRGANGKVRGVLTGLRYGTGERVVIADDDIRYDAESLDAVVRLLDEAEVVRPQNHFVPMPWHARWDTARSLLNRMTGGDWPGTLGVRRSWLLRTAGYDADVLFENLELVRTIRASGGREAVPLGLFVARRPPDVRHFWSQRTRQAYDELARPLRFAVSLALLPAFAALVATRRWTLASAAVVGTVLLAEMGRRRDGGRSVFPASASVMAPLWVAERAVCTWLALGSRILHGGVPYRGGVIRRAATPMRVLRERYGAHMAVGPIPALERMAA
jgi:hypothetical protein